MFGGQSAALIALNAGYGAHALGSEVSFAAALLPDAFSVTPHRPCGPPLLLLSVIAEYIEMNDYPRTMSRQSISPRSSPWISTSAVAILVAKGMLYTSHKRIKLSSFGSF